jgi:1-acyl-sn-glycerol-3-phosphate acyltransferase
MTGPASLAKDARTLTIRVPFALRKRGGRKLVVAPEGATWSAPRPRVDSTMVKAIARGFRWRKLLETGVYGTVEEIAAAELINPSYVSRVLRLTLLAPEIVEAVLDGRQPAEMTLAVLMKPFPVGWREQTQELSGRL